MPPAPILLIEDDAALREITQFELESEGYTVYTAENGREGLERLETIERPGLILLDLMMPEMDGWEFLQVVKKTAALAAIPIVLVSAFHAPPPDSPADAFLQKPVDLERLYALIKKYC